MNKIKLTGDLLNSISGVMIFLSLAHFIDLNGFTQFSPFIIIVGLCLTFWPKYIQKMLGNISFVTQQLLSTLSHILIFIGSKMYFDQFINNYWLLYLAIGIILLNKHDQISAFIYGGKQ